MEGVVLSNSADFLEDHADNKKKKKPLKKVLGKIAIAPALPAIMAAKVIKKQIDPGKKAVQKQVVNPSTGKTEIKTVMVKKKTPLQKTGKASIKAVKAVASVTVYAPLLPLVPMMNKMLKKKGYNPPKSMPDKTALFYNKIVRENKTSNYEHLPYIDMSNLETDSVAVAASVMVPAIISFIKTLKSKSEKVNAEIQQKGTSVEKLVAEEKQILKEVAKAEEKLIKEEIQNDPMVPLAAKPMPLLAFFKSPTGIIIGGIIALIILAKVFKVV